MHFLGISVWFAFSALLYANLAFQSSHEYYDYEQEEGDDGMGRLQSGSAFGFKRPVSMTSDLSSNSVFTLGVFRLGLDEVQRCLPLQIALTRRPPGSYDFHRKKNQKAALLSESDENRIAAF
ncbi:hypothetical protein C0J45_1248 [Silurus meridionalis]|nr:hypothetical protein C0J45_1248 [Silurus meridionalis]